MVIRDRIKDFRRIPAGSLKPNPKNWRLHPESQRQAIRSILDEIGFAGATLARELEDGSLELIDGHLRAEEAADCEIPVLILDVDEAEADKLLASLDPIGAMAKTHSEKLGSLLSSIRTKSESLREMFAGISHNAGVAPVGSVEAASPETPHKAVTKPGDVWVLGRHRLFCGDCTRRESVDKVVGADRPVLCFTSPPYFDARTYIGESDLTPEYLAGFIPAAIRHVNVFAVNLGIVRREGVIVPYWNEYIAAAERSGLGLVSWNIWDRGHAHSVAQATAAFPIEHEWIFVFANPKSKLQLMPTIKNETSGSFSVMIRQPDNSIRTDADRIKRDYRELGTVLRVGRANNNNSHPATFPVALPAAYIQSFVGDIYEPFCGSGTTIIAAEQLDRRCFACEISPTYCDVAIERWQELTKQGAIRE